MPTASTTDQARIRSTIEHGAQALRAKDAAALMQDRAPDFRLFSLAPPLVSPATRKGLEDWFATWKGGLGYEIRDLEITAGEDVAFAHGLVHLSGTKTDGQRNEVWYRLTLGLRRIDGTWKIVHEHESVPFYMDGSMRAAVDLKP